MQTSAQNHNIASQYSAFKIGKWTADPSTNSLSGKTQSISIEPKMMDVLAYMCEHAGEVISAEQLLIACWKGTFYGDAPVQKCIALLRKSLGCNARQPSFIETIHRRGYKIIAPVSFLSEKEAYTHIKDSWTDGSPYVGLKAFQTAHAPVYFGRTKAIADLINRLFICIENRFNFLLLLGKSGVGKSSLIRAGILPYLCAEHGFNGLKVSHYHILNPRSDDHKSALRIFLDGLQQLNCLDNVEDISALIKAIYQDTNALKTALLDFNKPAEECASSTKYSDTAEQTSSPDSSEQRYVEAELSATQKEQTIPVKEYKLLIIDQFEQLLLDHQMDDHEKAVLIACMHCIAQHQGIFLVTVLRNDFYANCVEVEGFSQLRDSGIQYDLQPAKPGEIAKMIRHPAINAGLHFEKDDSSGERLDDLLLKAASAHPDALPLLQYTLQQLYQHRSESNELLLSTYKKMGGLEGAMAQQAEDVFNKLPVASQACWHKVMYKLVQIDLANHSSIMAKKVPLHQFEDPEERLFIEKLIDARLFVSESRLYLEKEHTLPNEQSNSIEAEHEFIGIAHEALLKHWQRIPNWVEENRTALQKRIRLGNECQQWLEQNKDPDLLLTSYHALNDAKWLASREEIKLNKHEKAFIAQSSARQKSRKQFRRMAQFAFTIMFFVVTGLAIIASQQSQLAKEQTLIAQTNLEQPVPPATRT